MRTWTGLLISLVFIAASSFGQVKPDRINKNKLSVVALQAASAALLQFEKDQPQADPRNFYVAIEESLHSFYVDIVPNPTPIREGSVGNSHYIDIPSGGGNEHGRYIRYEVSKKGGTILKTTYSK